jgi:hypothetical protein
MVRQAHTYLVGAMSGATLIAIAIALFVLLVSAQVFRDWPIAALGGDDGASVSKAEPVGGTPTGNSGTAAAAGAGAARTASGGAAGGGNPAGRAGGSAPGATIEESGTAGAVAGGGGDGGGSGAGAPSGSAGSPAPSATNTSSGGGSGGGHGGGSGGGSESGTTTPSTSGKVTETVDDTVNQVDQTATGGALNEAGVTEATEGVVNGVAGPESTVGKVVDEAAGAVDGVLGAGR